MSLILASGSPRRRELLQLLGVPFRVLVADIDETPGSGETPETYVQRMASEKAQAVWTTLTAAERASTVILAADTTVVLGSQIMGKPVDYDDARRMLLHLSGQTHQVLTAFALATARGVSGDFHCTHVTFKTLSEQEILAYWNSGEPADKAGAYGIQGRGARYIRTIEGSYHSVMGLPLDRVADHLEAAGITLWQEQTVHEF